MPRQSRRESGGQDVEVRLSSINRLRSSKPLPFAEHHKRLFQRGGGRTSSAQSHAVNRNFSAFCAPERTTEQSFGWRSFTIGKGRFSSHHCCHGSLSNADRSEKNERKFTSPIE